MPHLAEKIFTLIDGATLDNAHQVSLEWSYVAREVLMRKIQRKVIINFHFQEYIYLLSSLCKCLFAVAQKFGSATKVKTL